MKRCLSLTLGIALLPLAASAWAESKARIVTSDERPTDCISRVQVNNIDDNEVLMPPLGFKVEPGRHTMTGRAVVNTRFCSTIGNRNSVQKVEPLEADFEAGKTYFVGYDHSSSDRSEWGLVIWKIEED